MPCSRVCLEPKVGAGSLCSRAFSSSGVDPRAASLHSAAEQTEAESKQCATCSDKTLRPGWLRVNRNVHFLEQRL